MAASHKEAAGKNDASRKGVRSRLLESGARRLCGQSDLTAQFAGIVERPKLKYLRTREATLFARRRAKSQCARTAFCRFPPLAHLIYMLRSCSDQQNRGDANWAPLKVALCVANSTRTSFSVCEKGIHFSHFLLTSLFDSSTLERPTRRRRKLASRRVAKRSAANRPFRTRSICIASRRIEAAN